MPGLLDGHRIQQPVKPTAMLLMSDAGIGADVRDEDTRKASAPDIYLASIIIRIVIVRGAVDGEPSD